MMVAVDFSPRMGSIVMTRRGATVERHHPVCSFSRRSATPDRMFGRVPWAQAHGYHRCLAPRDREKISKLQGCRRGINGGSLGGWNCGEEQGQNCRQISPDGTRLAWIAPNTNNVLQVWLKTVGQEDDKVVLYPDERHGFARPENRIDFNARAEAFLAQNLGGRAEPVHGDKYPGSTAVVKVIGT